jgi:probable HAF family extracellular repeat protein
MPDSRRPDLGGCAFPDAARKIPFQKRRFAMKFQKLVWVLWLIAVSLLANPVRLRAQVPSHHHYFAIDLGTLGGPNSSGCVPGCRLLNNQRAAVFHADTSTPDPFPSYPLVDGYEPLGVYWQNGQFTTLNSSPSGYDAFPGWVSDTGLVSGYAENGQVDPTTNFPEVRAVLWLNGVPIDLGTLGGNASVGSGVNNLGQVAGAALNRVSDPWAGAFYDYSYLPFAGSTQTHAFLWQFGAIRDLGTLGGPDSQASSVNEGGQVAGYSFTNATANETTGIPTIGPFLWAKGSMRDLGTLGGTIGLATGLNNLGQVIGQSDLAGDATFHPFLWNGHTMLDLKTLGGANGEAIWINDAGQVAGWADLNVSPEAHDAFLWENGNMKDLGTVDGDPCSTAYGLNSLGQVVGNSGDGSGYPGCGPKLHAFLWENGGPAVDLDALFAPLPSGLELHGACCINDQGEILGFGLLPNGDTHSVLLIPCDENHSGIPDCDYGMVDASSVTEAHGSLTPPAMGTVSSTDHANLPKRFRPPTKVQ